MLNYSILLGIMVKKSQSKIKKLSDKHGKKTAIIFVALFAVIGVITLFQANAAPKNQSPAVTLSLSPASQRVAVGNTLTVSVKLNTNGESVSGVQANLTYPATQLEYVSSDASSSVFGIEAQTSVENGTIKIGRANFTAVTSADALVTNITFRTLRAAKRVNVTFSSDSSVAREGDGVNILAKKINGQYTIF